MIGISLILQELPTLVKELEPLVEELSEIIITECEKREEEATEILNVLFEE